MPITTSAPTNNRKLITAAYYAAFIGLGLVGASLGPTLPNLAENTRTLLSQISVLFVARSAGYMVGSFLGGRLYDRFSGHRVMALALLVMAVTMFFVPVLGLFGVLAAALLILGLAEGTLDVGGNTLLVWLHRHNVGPAMNGLHFFFGVGAFLSPIIIAWLVLLSGGIRGGYWLIALVLALIALFLGRLPSPSIPHTATDEAHSQVDNILLGLIVVFFFLYAGAEVGFGGWIFTYATETDIASQTVAAYLTSAFWGALTIGRLVGMPIATKVRPRTILLTDLLGCLASLTLILLWPASLVVLIIGVLGLGFFMASIFPTTLSLAERRMTITGKTTGWFFVGASAGAMSLPWLIGQLFEYLGPQITIILILVDLGLAISVFAVLIAYSNQMVVSKVTKNEM